MEDINSSFGGFSTTVIKGSWFTQATVNVDTQLQVGAFDTLALMEGIDNPDHILLQFIREVKVKENNVYKKVSAVMLLVPINQFATSDYMLNNKLCASELVRVTHPKTGEECTAILLATFANLNRLKSNAVEDSPADGAYKLLEVDDEDYELVAELANKC